ncbi:unnamed protein product [Orchesella dallaii]|uniref:Transmembrane protein n=1 Tax=Orchesella dallaii TaxID=48710 RepID=A0ABP1S3J8_9HEXA
MKSIKATELCELDINVGAKVFAVVEMFMVIQHLKHAYETGRASLYGYIGFFKYPETYGWYFIVFTIEGAYFVWIVVSCSTLILGFITCMATWYIISGFCELYLIYGIWVICEFVKANDQEQTRVAPERGPGTPAVAKVRPLDKFETVADD